MEILFNLLRWLITILCAIARFLRVTGPSSRPASFSIGRFNISQISDHVFEVGAKPERPSVEIVCFHGLQLEDSAKPPHITTWLSRDASQVWLTWLLQDYKDTRILIVCYDASIEKTRDRGRLDLYRTCENLLGDLTQRGRRRASVGEAGCPIILVGHCLGGLILKEICNQAGARVIRGEGEHFKGFLENVKAVLFYASPHLGSKLSYSSTLYSKGSLFENVAPLDDVRSRRNEDFRKLQKKYKWKNIGVGEGLPVALHNFSGVIVEEASSRYDTDIYYTDQAADHFNICRPHSENNNSFLLLADLVDEVIKKEEASLPFKSDSAHEIVGLESSLRTMQRELSTQSRIAIVGMGGIGKTTLAKAVFEEVHRKYQYACLFQDVKLHVTRKENLRERVKEKLVNKRGSMVGNKFHWNDLKGQKVLLILDDVESEDQVRVMTDGDGFSKDSHVIVTTRDKGFIERTGLGFHIHEVEKLDHDISKELFCLCAFDEKEPPKYLSKRVEDIVKKCEGSPLALTVTGKYLKMSREECLWEEALKSLHEAEPFDGKKEDGMWSLLMPSYESLTPNTKELFLDAATYFHGKKLEEVQKVWKVCRISPNTGWKSLLDLHLVRERRDREWMALDDALYIDVHEVLRALGRKEAGLTRMSASKLHEISDEEAKSVQVLNGELQQHTLCRLTKLTNLNVMWLDVDDYKRRGLGPPSNYGSDVEIDEEDKEESDYECEHESTLASGHESDTNDASFDGSVLPKMLFARVYPVNSVSLKGIFKMKSLRYLILPRITLELPSTLWAEIGNLRRLQYLEMGGLCAQEILPEISKLQRLESLTIAWCWSLLWIPAEIGRLVNLRTLSIAVCTALTEISREIGRLVNLRTLSIAGCNALIEISREIGKLKSLETLTIEGCPELLVIPAEIGGLLNLRTLSITRCYGLEAIPAEISGLLSLRTLSIIECCNVEVIPKEINKLESLESLTLSTCERLEAIPAEIGGLINLRTLTITECDKVEAIPKEIGELLNLETLSVTRCNKVKAIPKEICGLANLQTLTITECDNVEASLQEIGQLQSLKSLQFPICDTLEVTSAIIGQRRNTQSLKLSQFLDRSFGVNLMAIIAEIGQLRRLTSINVSHFVKLVAIGKETDELESSYTLDICWDDDLMAIPAELDQLRNRTLLNISYQLQLVEITTSHFKLVHMPTTERWLYKPVQSLTISGCHSISAKPSEIVEPKWGLWSLKSLTITGCHNLTAIPSEIGELERLQSLTISECHNLTAIPSEVGELRFLRCLTISGCHNLMAIPSEMSYIRSLTDLFISECYNLMEIPSTIGHLWAVRDLTISGCYNLKEIPSGIGYLRFLRYLTISGCYNLTAIPTKIGQLLSLESLHISDCYNLKAIPSEIARLKRLESLHISGCYNLKTIPSKIGRHNLRGHPNISGCPNLVVPEDDSC